MGQVWNHRQLQRQLHRIGKSSRHPPGTLTDQATSTSIWRVGGTSGLLANSNVNMHHCLINLPCFSELKGQLLLPIPELVRALHVRFPCSRINQLVLPKGPCLQRGEIGNNGLVCSNRQNRNLTGDPLQSFAHSKPQISMRPLKHGICKFLLQ